MVHPGLLKCGKVEMESTIDRGNLSKILGNSLERVDPHRGEHLLGRTAHSARNEETIHDKTGRPDSDDVQGKANFEKFIVGSDTTEFVNKVMNQVRIRQKEMSTNAEDCTEHSILWGMFMATTLNAVTFMGKKYSTMQNVVQNEENIVSGESTEFEWNIFPGFTSLQLCDKISDLLSSLGQSSETFTGRILFMSMFNDISCEKKGNKEECLKYADFVATFARRFGIGQWSFIGPVLRKSGILLKTARKEPGTILQKRCYFNLQKVDIPSSEQRHHCPEES